MVAGVSFVICTRNGAPRLPATLAHLAALRLRDDVRREVLLVDNASTDDTCEIAKKLLREHPNLPLRIIHEPVPGTGFARVRGLREAHYDYVTFVDDDNWLTPDFGQIAFDLMQSDPSIGLLPARSEAVFAGPKPPWFDSWQGAFAVGEQFSHEGDVSGEHSHWWTAGLTVRRAAWLDLIDHGFRPRVRGRDGRSLGAGEDTEMCLAILIAGWRAHYDARLLFRHWMPADRLTWAYACRLTYQGQIPIPAISAYRVVLGERTGAQDRRLTPTASSWPLSLVRQVARAALRSPRIGLRFVRNPRVDIHALWLLSSVGTIVATARYGERYNRLLAELRAASWLGNGPQRIAQARVAERGSVVPELRVCR